MRKETIYYFCDKAAFILLCVLMGDCCIFGAGQLISFGSIGFRMIVLAALLIVSLPLMILHIKDLLKNKYLWLVVLFGLWLIVATVMGLVNGNRKTLIVSDLKGFAYFIMLPVAICVLRKQDYIHKLMKCMMYCSAFSAIFILVMLCMYLWNYPLFSLVSDFCTSNQITAFGVISPSIPRLFFRSVLYLLCGCGFSIYFQLISSKRKISLQYVVIIVICLFALLMSYTRSVYLAAACAAVGIVIFLFWFSEKEIRKKMIKQLGMSIIGFLLVSCVFSILARANYIEYAVFRSTVDEESFEGINPTDPSQENLEQQMQSDYLELTLKSDQLRELTLQGLYRNISKSPILGNGLGAEFKERPDGLNEYFYLDLLSKAGAIGLLLYLLPFILMVIQFVRNIKKKNSLNAVWLFVLIGFLAFSWFNPYMNASLGILFYCCVIGVFSFNEKCHIKIAQ